MCPNNTVLPTNLLLLPDNPALSALGTLYGSTDSPQKRQGSPDDPWRKLVLKFCTKTSAENQCLWLNLYPMEFRIHNERNSSTNCTEPAGPLLVWTSSDPTDWLLPPSVNPSKQTHNDTPIVYLHEMLKLMIVQRVSPYCKLSESHYRKLTQVSGKNDAAPSYTWVTNTTTQVIFFLPSSGVLLSCNRLLTHTSGYWASPDHGLEILQRYPFTPTPR